MSLLFYLLIVMIHSVIVTYVYVRNDWHSDYYGDPNILFALHLILSIIWPVLFAGYVIAGPVWLTYKLATKHREKNVQ